MIAKLIQIYSDGSNLWHLEDSTLGVYPMPDGVVPKEAIAARDAVRKASMGNVVLLTIEDGEA